MVAHAFYPAQPSAGANADFYTNFPAVCRVSMRLPGIKAGRRPRHKKNAAPEGRVSIAW